MSDQLDRRTFIAQGLRTAAGLAVIGGGAPALLAACSTSSGSNATATGATGVSTATPKRGGHLTVGVTSEVNGFDPSASDFDATGYMYAETVFDPLTTVAANGQPQPYLAESFEPNQDYTVWTIGVRPGVVFHDGTPLDASVVKLNLDDRRSSLLVGPALSDITDVTVTGPMTVQVTMATPWVPFPYYMSAQPGYMVAPKMIANKATAARNPIGTGPFVFKEWVPNDHFSATRNPHYWRAGLPYLDSVEYRPIIDPTAAENTLKSGGVNILSVFAPQNIASVRQDSSLVTIDDSKDKLAEPSAAFVMLNTAAAPADDIRVRQALAYATNRQQNVSVLSEGVFQVSNGPFKPGSPYYEANSGYPNYDPGKAKSLVQAYEHDKGPISLTLNTNTATYVIDAAQLLQANWQSVGIQTRIQQIDQAQLIVNVLEGRYQSTLWGQFGASDPDENYVWWSTETVGANGQFSLNFARNKDPMVQAALQQGRTQSDPTARANAYRQLSGRFAQDLPYLWLAFTVSAVSAQPQVMNFNYNTLPNGTRTSPMFGGVFPVVQTWLQS